MNRTIRLLLVSDVFVVTGFGLIEPILAVYITNQIPGGTLSAAGIASFIFLITKSLIQLPFARYVDAHPRQSWGLLVGSLLVMTTPILYLFASSVTGMYVAQFVMGVGSALAYPTWLGLWSTNLDRNQESYEWSLYSTLTGLGSALSAAIGATIAERFGFQATFAAVWLASLVGVIILFQLRRAAHLRPRERRREPKPVWYIWPW